jgi:hypothetical protein
MRLRSNIHSKNIIKQGNVKQSLIKKEDEIEWGPIILAIVLILVYNYGYYYLKLGSPNDL